MSLQNCLPAVHILDVVRGNYVLNGPSEIDPLPSVLRWVVINTQWTWRITVTRAYVLCTEHKKKVFNLLSYNEELMSRPKGGRSVQLRGTAFESERLQHFPYWGERERAPSCGLNGRAVTIYIYIYGRHPLLRMRGATRKRSRLDLESIQSS